MIKLLKKLDLFGVPISLTMKEHYTSKTIIGGFMTILNIILLVSLAAFYIDRIESTPLVNTERKDLRNPQFYINQTSIPVAFQIVNPQNILIDYVNLEITAFMATNNNSIYDISSYSEVPLKLEPCQWSHFPKLSEEVFFDSGLTFFQCIKNQSILLQGGYDQEIVKYGRITFSPCKNSTTKTNCPPIEYIQNLINNDHWFVQVALVNEEINTMSMNDYIKYNVNVNQKILSWSMFKVLNFFLRNHRLESDNNFIYSSLSNYSSVSFDYLEVDQDSIDATGTLMEIRFYPSQSKTVYHRSYTKLPSVLANIGGMSQLMVIGFRIINMIFSIFNMKTYILNGIFEYDYVVGRKKRTKRLNIHTPITLQRIEEAEQNPIEKKRKSRNRRIQKNIPEIQDASPKNPEVVGMETHEHLNKTTRNIILILLKFS
jgi:hypothetical protein